MDYPFHKFRGRGISVGPEGISVGPGNSVNIGGQQWFGRGKHGKRFRLGDVRAAVLVLLAEQPMHGYQIIQEIAERTGDLWHRAQARSIRYYSNWRTKGSSSSSKPKAAK